MEKWTEEEIEFLKKNYCSTENKILSNHLNRPITSVVVKANRDLKLKKLKFCKICKNEITNLNRNAIVCKLCSTQYYKDYKRKWAFENKEKIIERSKIWRLKNEDHTHKISKLWRLKNEEKIKVDNKTYYKRIKNLMPPPTCINCNKLVVGKGHNTKRCLKCNKKHKQEYNKTFRIKRIDYYRELTRKYRKNRRDRENQRRIKLGLPLIGNNFKKEQELLFYIKNIFSDKKIIYHDRSALGNGLELDMFIPELNLAIEYQGRQHFNFDNTNYWANYDEFEAQKLRDTFKKFLCKVKNIILIEIYYYEKLDEQLILTKLYKKNFILNQSRLFIQNKDKNGGN